MIDTGYAEESPEIDSSRYMMQVSTSCFVSFCFWNEHLIYMHAHIYRALDKIAYHASTPLISCMPFVEGIEAFTLQGHSLSHQCAKCFNHTTECFQSPKEEGIVISSPLQISLVVSLAFSR